MYTEIILILWGLSILAFLGLSIKLYIEKDKKGFNCALTLLGISITPGVFFLWGLAIILIIGSAADYVFSKITQDWPENNKL